MRDSTTARAPRARPGCLRVVDGAGHDVEQIATQPLYLEPIPEPLRQRAVEALHAGNWIGFGGKASNEAAPMPGGTELLEETSTWA